MGGRGGDEGVVVMVVSHAWEGEGLLWPQLIAWMRRVRAPVMCSCSGGGC
jgi:hypothetical protein